jgi:LPS-assembly protein
LQRTLLPLAVLLTLAPGTSPRAADPDTCPLLPTGVPTVKPPRPAPGTPATVTADEVNALGRDWAEFTGNVELRRGEERIRADRLRYHKPTDTVEAGGQVGFETVSRDRFEVESLRLNLGDHTGEATAARYRLGPDRARGDARRIDFLGEDRTRLTDVRYTTCREGQDSWFLRVRQLELNADTRQGVARGVKVEFFDVPIFYFPYLHFPLGDQRMSGFLAPEIGRNDKLGTVVALPYYFNIAPHLDDTFTPRLLTDRGLMLQNEFRYLTRQSEGRLSVEWLGNDRIIHDDRAAGYYLHQHRLSPAWSALVDLRAVSDKDYLADFGDRLQITSQTHLPQTGELNYRGPRWAFTARASSFQTVDKTILPADRPYSRLPQFTLGLLPPGGDGWRPHLDAEWVRFERDTGVTGARATLRPALSLPVNRAWGHFTPKLGAHYIGYRLDTAPDDSPAVVRGFGSLDGGLVFERGTSFGGRPYQQTLEPRVYYLYVPSKSQNGLPVFDTTPADFSFDGLFRENRFSGGDRIGDANQLTLAITSRTIDDGDGQERLRLSLGQIVYFDERQVNLPAGTDTRTGSDLAAEVSAWLIGNWHLRAGSQWDPDNNRAQKSSFFLQYQPDRRRILNLGYRFVRDQVGQTDLSIEWPVVSRWTARARSVYSFHDERNVDSTVGLEYHACCWAFRAFAYRRHESTRGQVNGIMLQLELTGLSKLGAAPDSPLGQSLFSFPPPAGATGR